MKKLVLTASFGDRPFKQYTIDSIQKYANKIDADFRCVEEFEVDPKFNSIPLGRGGNTAYLIKLLVIRDALVEYDRVIWFDDSCIVTSDCPDLFQTVPYKLFGAHNEGILDWVLADQQTKGLYERNGIKDVITSQNYFNSGIVVVSKDHAALFNDDLIVTLGNAGHFKNAYPDQNYLNYLIANNRIPYFPLPSIFNRMAVNLAEIKGKRVNYETFEPIETGVAKSIQKFGWLNEENTKVGQLNGAFIYHITSMYEGEGRYNLIKRLHEIKVDK